MMLQKLESIFYNKINPKKNQKKLKIIGQKILNSTYNEIKTIMLKNEV